MKISAAKHAPVVWVGSISKGQWFGTGENYYAVMSADESGVEAVNVRTMEVKRFGLAELVYYFEEVVVMLGVGGFRAAAASAGAGVDTLPKAASVDTAVNGSYHPTIPVIVGSVNGVASATVATTTKAAKAELSLPRWGGGRKVNSKPKLK